MADLTLYLVRHGETEYNRRGLMQGQRIDAPLNEIGLAQARALGSRFRDVDLDAIYVSPLRRALQTAQPVVDCHPHTAVHVDPALAEMSWGGLEGRSVDEVADVLLGFTERWRNGEFEGSVEGGESILDVAERARGALERIGSRYDGGTVLAVTHGRFLRVLLATALPEYGLRRMDRFPHTNTGVYRITWKDGVPALDLSNCTEHLEWKGDAA